MREDGKVGVGGETVEEFLMWLVVALRWLAVQMEVQPVRIASTIQHTTNIFPS
jgi:hypothetical protein